MTDENDEFDTKYIYFILFLRGNACFVIGLCSRSEPIAAPAVFERCVYRPRHPSRIINLEAVHVGHLSTMNASQLFIYVFIEGL